MGSHGCAHVENASDFLVIEKKLLKNFMWVAIEL